MLKIDKVNKISNLLVKKLSKVILPDDILSIEFDIIRFKKLLKYNISQKQFLNFFILVFKKLLKDKGTIIIPSFSYSWGYDKKKKIYNIKSTKANTGILPNYFLNNKDFLRTADPMFSFLIYGKNKKFFQSTSKDSFGKNSIYEKILKKNGKLISFGIPRFDPTFVHYVEQFFDENIRKIKYRKKFKYQGMIVNKKNKKKQQTHYSFMRPKKSNLTFSENKIVKILDKKKLIKKIKFFEGLIQIVTAKNFFDIGIEGMKKDINFFTKKIK